jgi:hypothetical protein
MVAVAQLVESRIVIPVVVGSSPISHPNKYKACSDAGLFYRPANQWGVNIKSSDLFDNPEWSACRELIHTEIYKVQIELLT